MMRKPWRFAFLVSIAALVLASPGLASAECEGERGFGGTGRSGNDNGFGGTGKSDERGFGGTGREGRPEDGQGAALYGTVTGFGSLCINGLRVGYNADTPVKRDGISVPADSLRRGHTVRVDAVARGDRLEAVRIDLRPAVSGPVTRVDRAGGRLEVMRQVVEVPRALRGALREIAPGDPVAVHGLRDGDGRILATRLEGAPESAPASVVGIPRVLPNGRFAIGRLHFRADAAPAGRGAVVVTGQFAADRGMLDNARSAPVFEVSADTRVVSVEAWVTASARARLTTAIVEVDTSRADLPAEGVDVGTRVWVFGGLGDDGVLVADRVDVDPVGGGAPDPPDVDDSRRGRSQDDDDDHSGRGRGGRDDDDDGRGRDHDDSGGRDDDDNRGSGGGGDFDDDGGGGSGSGGGGDFDNDHSGSGGGDFDNDSGGPDLDDGDLDFDNDGPDIDDGGLDFDNDGPDIDDGDFDVDNSGPGSN